MLGIIVNSDIIVYIFSLILFMALGLLKLYLDKKPYAILSNHGISMGLVLINYIMGIILLIAISRVNWFYIF